MALCCCAVTARSKWLCKNEEPFLRSLRFLIPNVMLYTYRNYILVKTSAKVMHKLLFNNVCKWSDAASQPGPSVAANYKCVSNRIIWPAERYIELWREKHYKLLAQYLVLSFIISLRRDQGPNHKIQSWILKFWIWWIWFEVLVLLIVEGDLICEIQSCVWFWTGN